MKQVCHNVIASSVKFKNLNIFSLAFLTLKYLSLVTLSLATLSLACQKDAQPIINCYNLVLDDE